jgi:hypothetical protein
MVDFGLHRVHPGQYLRVCESRPSLLLDTHSYRARQRLASLTGGSANFGSGPNSGSGGGQSGRAGVATFYEAPKSTSPRKSWFSRQNYRELKEQLGAAGLSGLASYGVFNTLYYFFSYLGVFFLSLPADALRSQDRGIFWAISYCTRLLMVVWGGSQITKVPRAACALAAAPAMDRLLAWIRDRLNLQSKRNAFLMVIVPACWILFFLLIAISVIVLL